MKYFGMVLIFAAVALSGCGEDSEPTRPNTFVPLTSLEADVNPPSVPSGTFSRVAAVGDFSGAFTRDLSDEVVWTSSDPSVASVSEEPGEEAVVFADTPGTATLTAETEGFTATTDFTVTDAVIEALSISPSSETIAAGMTRSIFTAEGSFSDGTVLDLTPVVEWSSGDEAIALVGEGFRNGGEITALSPGDTIITAAFDGLPSDAALTVTDAEIDSLEISPISPDLPVDFTLQFKATANFSDDTSEDVTEEVLWESSDETVATIRNTAGEAGLAEGIAPGETRISAILGDLEAETIFTVTDILLDRIEFTDDVIDLTSNVINLSDEPFTFTTVGLFSDNTEMDLTESATFTSSDETVAQISNVAGRRGELTTISRGTVTITAEVNGIRTEPRILTIR